jgi:hypothetical protein
MDYSDSNGIGCSKCNSTVNAIPEAKVVSRSRILKASDMNEADWNSEEKSNDANLPTFRSQNFRNGGDQFLFIPLFVQRLEGDQRRVMPTGLTEC